MAARGIRVAGEREPADDRVAVLDDIDRRVGVPLQRTQVAALLGDAAPAVRAQQPPALFAADRVAELDQRRRVLGPRRPDHDAHTTIPWPPRRGSPAASSVPSAPQLDRRDAAEVEVQALPRDHLPSPAGSSSAVTGGPASLEMELALADDVEARPRDRLRHARACDRRRRRPARSRRRAAPSRRCRASARAPVLEHERRRHHARQPLARDLLVVADHVELAEHVVELGSAADRCPTRPRASRRARRRCRRRRRRRRASCRRCPP